jgi:flagellar motor switch/type III secretory pathway protein FliN
MPGACPLRAWRDAELAAIADLVRVALQAWRDAWGLCLESALVQCTPATAADHEAPWLLAGSAAEGAAWLAWTAAFERQLTLALWDVEEVAGPLARQVTAACRDDLAARLIAGLRMTAAAGPPPAAARIPSTWSGEVAVRFDGGARLLLDGDAVASILGWAAPATARTAATPGRAPLTSISAAVDAIRMPLRARLADCEIDLASLQDLCVGDIVPVRHRLDEPLQVRDAAGQIVFGGFLARRGQRKALELAAPPTTGAQRP